MGRTEKAKADDLNFHALLKVLQSGMWLQADIERYLGDFKLSHGRFSILLSLSESEDHTLIGNELAAMLGVAKPTITKMAGKLLADGLLRISIDETDSRKKKYFLTKKAEKLLEELIPGYVDRLSTMSAGLTEEEKRALIRLLSKIDFLDQKKPSQGKEGGRLLKEVWKSGNGAKAAVRKTSTASWRI